MEVRLDNRVALITGGSKGLGRAMALRFAEAGAAVAIAARGADALEAARSEIVTAVGGGNKVAAIAGDVSTAEGCRKVHDAAVAALGPIDILVNNAGIAATGKFLEITDAQWQADLDLKLFAAIRLSRLALPGMQERKWGRIINVLASIAKAPVGGSAPTAVSRMAGLTMTKILANEAAPHGVLVNALLVGKIESDQWARRHAAMKDGTTYESYLDGLKGGIPLGRVGRADEFATVALMLASDTGSYVAGVGINVDGGLSPVW
jgi:3-oxoacyl-[acyl-carrier protein] reductase